MKKINEKNKENKIKKWVMKTKRNKIKKKKKLEKQIMQIK